MLGSYTVASRLVTPDVQVHCNIKQRAVMEKIRIRKRKTQHVRIRNQLTANEPVELRYHMPISQAAECHRCENSNLKSEMPRENARINKEQTREGPQFVVCG